ncbi:gamma-glutamylcyclotransferase [Methylophilus glucosoxydans]|uniref:Gamma-glutamylcyclotransferase n=1 Tax=Methylophilus glucosoxydans TaxID=752553 RepID=A0ABW3GK76_9PROT
MNDLLFVYGTLRQGNTHAMSLYLAQQADFVAYGWFQGLMYQISFYPGVVASNDHSHRVYGEVYRLRDAQSVLAMLDEYEECSVRHPQPAEYQRVQTQIITIDDQLLEPVWIYLYQWPVADKARIVTGDFMHPIQMA